MNKGHILSRIYNCMHKTWQSANFWQCNNCTFTLKISILQLHKLWSTAR